MPLIASPRVGVLSLFHLTAKLSGIFRIGVLSLFHLTAKLQEYLE